MRIKSYFANSVQEAIDKAREELGSDAMLMNSKRTELELRTLGAYEVVFGVAGDAKAGGAGRDENKRVDEAVKRLDGAGAPASPVESAAVAARSAAGRTVTRATPPAGNQRVQASDLIRELADLRQQIETVKRSVNRQGRARPAAGTALHRDGDEISARLMAADFSEDLANEIAEAVEGRLAAGGEALDAALVSELESRFSVAPEFGVATARPPAVLFAGPAGGGKTTSLIKLALRHGLQARLPVQILSLDTLRVGGWEQLAAYARITGIAFDAVYNPAALDRALGEHRGKKLILIDTPGYSPVELLEKPDLAAWLAREPEVEVQLVLPAGLRSKVAQSGIERFADFRPAKLLLTHMDELGTPGAVLEIAIRSGLPLSYLADGPQIPEDIRPAAKERLLEPFVRQARRAAPAA